MGIREDKEWHRQKSNADHKAAMNRAHGQEMNEIQKQNRKASGNNQGGGSGCMLTLLVLAIPIINALI